MLSTASSLRSQIMLYTQVMSVQTSLQLSEQSSGCEQTYSPSCLRVLQLSTDKPWSNLLSALAFQGQALIG